MSVFEGICAFWSHSGHFRNTTTFQLWLHALEVSFTALVHSKQRDIWAGGTGKLLCLALSC